MAAAPLSPTDSLLRSVVPIEAGAHVTAAGFVGGAPAFALGDGTVLIAGDADPVRVAAHPDGAILVAAFAADRIVSGGDDGRLVATGRDGTTVAIDAQAGGWVDALALHPSGGLAWASGRTVRARAAKGETRSVTAPSSVRGLHFAPKGFRLAFSHYNGASLWYPNSSEPPETLAWKGSHLDVTWSPDGRFVVTTMQENAMHGWRVADGKHMRMSGYPAKPRSVSWSPDGHWLATSGAEACVVWPFDGKDGPMNKAPKECAVRASRVARVAFHPRAAVLALGYEDGLVLLCRMADTSEILVRAEDPASGGISALAWDEAGARLLFGTAGGRAGVLTLPA